MNSERDDKAEWIAEHPTLIKKAWQYAVCMREGGCDAPEDESVAESPVLLLASAEPQMHLLAKSSSEEANETPLKTYDPSENVAAPGNTSRQRLAQSGRSTDAGDAKEQVDPGTADSLEPIPIVDPQCGSSVHQQCLKDGVVNENQCSILFVALVDEVRSQQMTCMDLSTKPQKEMVYPFEWCNDHFDEGMLHALDSKRKCMEEISSCPCTP